MTPPKGFNDVPLVPDKAYRLSQASGALEDIIVTVTSCLPSYASDAAVSQAKSILHRILCSADKVRARPSWFRFDWERELWEQYERGELNACATDRPCIEVSRQVCPPEGR